MIDFSKTNDLKEEQLPRYQKKGIFWQEATVKNKKSAATRDPAAKKESPISYSDIKRCAGGLIFEVFYDGGKFSFAKFQSFHL